MPSPSGSRPSTSLTVIRTGAGSELLRSLQSRSGRYTGTDPAQFVSQPLVFELELSAVLLFLLFLSFVKYRLHELELFP